LGFCGQELPSQIVQLAARPIPIIDSVIDNSRPFTEVTGNYNQNPSRPWWTLRELLSSAPGKKEASEGRDIAKSQ
jgi:hypothetical protein